MKIGLYSITYLGVWYDGAALTLDEVIRRAAKFGYDGVEIDGKRPHGHPMDMPASLCRELRQKASDGSRCCGASAGRSRISSSAGPRSAGSSTARDSPSAICGSI